MELKVRRNGTRRSQAASAIPVVNTSAKCSGILHLPMQ